jgi:lipid A 3-O-deacylase
MRSLTGLFLILTCFAFSNESKPALLSVGVGVFNVVKPNRSSQYQLEYKPAPSFYGIRPLVGAFATDKASFYIYGGMFYDIYLGKGFILTPSFAPGFYFKGNGKNLHYPLEFRSCLEIAYEFKNKSRFGAQFYHISNASLAHKNPGEESLIFYYAIPLSYE